jgi:outer membrane lipoprotein SlyB
MKTTHAIFVALITSTVLVSGCANNHSHPAATQSYYSTYGVVDTIDVVRGGDSGIGAGTVIGGVIGGVLGNQVGSGRGNTAATIAGAAGGAVVGHEIEKRNQTRDRYQIRVRLDNGRYQTVTQDDMTGIHVGNRVRIESDRVYRD